MNDEGKGEGGGGGIRRGRHSQWDGMMGWGNKGEDIPLQSEIGFGKLETYEKLDKLGEGTYATVFRGRSLLTMKYVALKVWNTIIYQLDKTLCFAKSKNIIRIGIIVFLLQEIRLEQEEGAPCTAIREVDSLNDLWSLDISNYSSSLSSPGLSSP